MATENDKIKDLFSSKLGNFEPEVPASLWGGLDQLLSQQPAPVADGSSSASSSSSRSSASSAGGTATKISLIKTILIAAGVAAAVVAGVILVPEGETPIVQDPPVVATTDTVRTEEKTTLDTASFIAPVPEVIIPHRTSIAVVEDVPVKEDTPGPERIPDVPAEKKKEPEIIKEPDEERMLAKAEPQKVIIDKSKRASDGFSIGLLANAGVLSSDTKERGGALLFSAHDRSSDFTTLLKEENEEYKLKHDMPVSFGIKVSKGIAPNLSLETGVVYTYLSSKVTSGSKVNIGETQSFHYLGIPISLNYTFYEIGKAKFYVTAGGMIQKDIKGKYVSHMGLSAADVNDPILTEIYYKEPYYIREDIKQSKPQFSVHATLGVSYPIYRKLRVYGTVGGAYYFDAGNKYKTIYSDRKTQLDLNLGIKFDF